MKTINVGVIGLGYWGPNLVRNFTKVPGVKVVMAADLSQKNLAKINESYPAIRTTLKHSDIIKNKQIDIIAIATPLKTHFSLAKEALIAKKHILIEKPMASSTLEATELIQLAKKNKRTIMVGHTFVYSEAVKKIKELITKKSLGKLYYYDSTRINLGLIQSDTNVIWDLAPHDLSILNYIFPVKPLRVAAFGKSFVKSDNEEIAHIFITFEKGITAHIHVSWLSPVKIRNIFVAGSKKMIVYNDIEPSEKIRIYDKGVSIVPSSITPFSPAYRSGEVTIPPLPQNEALYNELSHFVSCIRINKQPITNGEAGLQVLKLLEACDQALKTRTEIVIHE